MLHAKVLAAVIAVPVCKCRAGATGGHWLVKIMVVSGSIGLH